MPNDEVKLPAGVVMRICIGPIGVEPDAEAVTVMLLKGAFHLMFENDKPFGVVLWTVGEHRLVPVIVKSVLPPCGTVLGTIDETLGPAAGHTATDAAAGTQSVLRVFLIAVKAY